MIIKGAPYLNKGRLVYIAEVIDDANVKVIYAQNGVSAVPVSELVPAFPPPVYKWKLEDLFVDVSVPVQVPGREAIPWEEWIDIPYNRYIRSKNIYDMPVFGVYKDIFFEFAFLKEKVIEHVNLSNGKI